MTEEKKILTGGINADDAYFLQGDGDYNNAINADFVRHHGRQGRFEAVLGTRLVDNIDLPSGENLCIGSYEDVSNSRLFFAIWNDGGDHGIFCYDQMAGVIRTVLRSSDVVGGLGFSDSYFINGMFLVNNSVLYWNDGLNEPRRINVEAAIKSYDSSYETTYAGYVLPLERQHLSLVRRVPGLPPLASKIIVPSNEAPSNQVADDAFQFAYRYVYRDYERSKLSPYSVLINRNKPDDEFNAVGIEIPFEEPINQDVLRIDLVARNLSTNQHYIFKSLEANEITSEISDHNAGTTRITRVFLNDTVGVTLSESDANLQFDSVPLVSKTMEIANSRVFLGNNIEGYDTSKVTSLTATPVVAGDQASVVGRWFRLRFNTACGANPPTPYTVYLLDITGIAGQDGYYEWASGVVPPFPSNVLYTDCTFRGAGLFDVMNAVGVGGPGCQNIITEFSFQDATSIIDNAPPAENTADQRVFKSAAAYRVGIAFHDFAGRKSGVYTSDDLKVFTQDRNYANITYTTGINWTLDTNLAQQEIPEWAAYYSINISRCLRTRFFFQLRSDDVTYASKDPDGNWVYDDNYQADRKGLAISAKSMFSLGLGYEYNPGDIIKIYVDGTPEPYSQKVVAQDGDYIICDLVNLGNLAPTFSVLYEVYTPYRELGNEPIFEVAQIFPVLNPGTSTRTYSVPSGSIQGDVWLLMRNQGATQYLVEAMTLVDKYWQLWYTDHGRPNFIDSIGQVKKTNNISFSNQYINGTKVNGLSSFDPLDESNEIPLEGGSIQKLQLVNKPQEPGTVMLVIQENETSSVYLGESEIQDGSGSPVLAISRNVIGSINSLKGGYGTTHHESVAREKGNVYWWDQARACVVMYGANGLETPSKFKLDTEFRKIADNMYFAMANPSDYRLSGKRMIVVGGINPSTSEYQITFPRVFNIPVSQVLFDQVIEEVPLTFGQQVSLPFRASSEQLFPPEIIQ